MARGWSLGALVKSLGSAAFKNIGLNSGDVQTINAFGNGVVKPTIKQNLNWQTYQFRTGEYLYVELGSSVNKPGDFDFMSTYVAVSVLGGTDIGYTTLIISPVQGMGAPITLSWGGADGSRVWSVKRNAMMVSDINQPNIGDPNYLKNKSQYGIYGQPSDASALVSSGYPIQEAGSLSVEPSAYGCRQEYTTYANGRKFTRNQDSAGNWAAWSEFLRLYSEQIPMFGGVSLSATAPYMDFYFNKNTSQSSARLISDANGQLSLQSYTSTRVVLKNTGRYSGISYWGTWATGMSAANVAYNVEDAVVADGSYLPFISNTARKSSGWTTNVSYGQFITGGNAFNNPVIVAYNENGNSYGIWQFINQSGDINYLNSNGSRSVAFQDWTIQNFYTKPEIEQNWARMTWVSQGFISGFRLVRQPAVTTGGAGGVVGSGGVLIGGNFDDDKQFMEWVLVQYYINGNWVTAAW